MASFALLPDMPDWPIQTCQTGQTPLIPGLKNPDTGQNTLILDTGLKTDAGPRVTDARAG